jgi:leucyl aminopeptidase
MGGVLGVGQGSEQAPRFLKMTYAPSGARGRPLALVGKGVVFDSGGLSLKTAGGMETMKTDMSGAAAVIAAMSALRDLGVKTRVLGYIPLVENMPSGNAMRPGDVLRIRNGKTVEVLNTDAEGRLILADGLSLAVEEGVDAIVDLATLTGACVVALGDKSAGLMGNDDDWSDQVRAAADRAGEPVWPLPLPTEYRKQLESEVADMKNIGGSYGGALTAGLFLQEFVDGAPWVHLDIAGPARAGADDGYLTKGGTGFGVRTLVELARSFEVPAK